MDADLKSVDTLRFQGMASYKDRLKKYQESTGLIDAVISGHGILDGYKVAIAVMDFSFLAATMGSVVGEKNHAHDRIRHRAALRQSSSSQPPAAPACMREC